jgi:hypothetical protein
MGECKILNVVWIKLTSRWHLLWVQISIDILDEITTMIRVETYGNETLKGAPKDRGHPRVVASSETVGVPSQVISHLSHVTTVKSTIMYNYKASPTPVLSASLDTEKGCHQGIP